MSGFETDFITGRSIGEDDLAVAIVIAPKSYGYPNPKDYPAQPPIYPDTLYDAISLPLRGVLDQDGYFEPDQNQMGLEIFEHLIGSSWNEFRSKALNHPEGKVRLASGTVEEEVVAPGIAIMHSQTADILAAFSKNDRDKRAEAQKAVSIVLDAAKRVQDGDSRYWNVANMGSPVGRTYITLSGEKIEIPEASHALRELEPSLLRDSAKSSLKNFILRPKIDNQKLEQAFSELASFQDITWGMRVLNRHLTPSPFTRGDNMLEVVTFNMKSCIAAITGLSGRLFFHEGNADVDVELRKIADLANEAAVAADDELQRRKAARATRDAQAQKLP